MQTLRKKELVVEIAERIGRPYADVDLICQSFMDQIVMELAAGNRLKLHGFGVFELRHYKERVARNPKTGEAVMRGARRAVFFKPGPTMKKVVKKKEEDA